MEPEQSKPPSPVTGTALGSYFNREHRSRCITGQSTARANVTLDASNVFKETCTEQWLQF
jgi:hypothetical protein